MTDKLFLAARAVVREALDNVEVHPCDEHDDSVRAKGLYGTMQNLHAALSSPQQEPVAWLLTDQRCSAIDDCEDYERVELVKDLQHMELERFLLAGCAEPLYTAAPASPVKAQDPKWREQYEMLLSLDKRHIPANFTTHRESWRCAIEDRISATCDEDKAYWRHELEAYDCAFTRLLSGELSHYQQPAVPVLSDKEILAIWCVIPYIDEEHGAIRFARALLAHKPVLSDEDINALKEVVSFLSVSRQATGELFTNASDLLKKVQS